VSQVQKVITVTFYRLPSEKEPVRDWLLKLAAADRKIIGADIMVVEMGWPCGEPLCKSLSGYAGLREVRSDLPDGRIAQVFFYVSGSEMILLHGFVKKSQKTPEKELKLANKRKKEHERYETEKN
jgi:phage-related protein